jgi:hypothetical protein
VKFGRILAERFDFQNKVSRCLNNGSSVIWFTQGGTEAGEAGAAGERFGIFIGLWAPTFMSIGNGIDNLKD